MESTDHILVVDDDAEIRRHTEPWMEHICRFLGIGGKQHKTERTFNL